MKAAHLKKQAVCLWAAAALTSGSLISFPARADSPVILAEDISTEEYTAVDGNLISDDDLYDSVVEYRELGSLIHVGNETVRQMQRSTDDTRQDYKEIKEYLQTEGSGSSRSRREAKDDGNVEETIEQGSYAAIYKSAAKSYNDMLKQLNRYSSNKTRISTERQLTNAAQSLMISWQSVELQKEYLSTMASLYQELYKNTLVSQSAGLATEQDVESAYDNWQDMEVSLASLGDSTESILQNLGSILGVNDENVQWQRIPAVDVSRVQELDLEADTYKAINNNSDMISTRSSSSDLSTGGLNKKNRAESELEEKIRIQMQQLYEDVMQAKQAYDAAQTGYESASLRYQTTEQKYSLGMLSQAEYLQEKISYVQKKTAFESADLTLLQALETYQWAVKGIMTIE